MWLEKVFLHILIQKNKVFLYVLFGKTICFPVENNLFLPRKQSVFQLKRQRKLPINKGF